MVDVNDYIEEKECIYKDECYSVRDNGAVMRHCREGKRPRKDDGVWTFGKPNTKTGYMDICGERVHRIVAYAFLGEPPTPEHVVDHIDTNRRNNRPNNLRWLTRLENILLNETTRSKIEYLCGSVEEFLKDPSILKASEGEDRNFSWMRTVSKVEAENTLLWWEKLKNNPRPQMQSSGLGGWMYSNPNKDSYIIAKENTNEPPSNQTFEETTPDDISHQKPRNVKENVTKKNKVDWKEQKKIFISRLIDISLKHGWNVQKNFSGEGLKTDILISLDDRKIAVNVNRMKSSVLNETNRYIDSGIEVYWFDLKKTNDCYYDDETLLPYFQIENNSGNFFVRVNESEEYTIDNFLEAAVDNKVVNSKEVSIKDIKVQFMEVNCYKCQTEYTLYVIPKIKFGNQYCVNNDVDHPLTIDEFDPIVIESVRKYVLNHPEVDFSTDIIKERGSITRGESYMSFGCPICNAIYGEHYLEEIRMDSVYENDSNFQEIHLEGDGIKIEYPHWTIKNKD